MSKSGYLLGIDIGTSSIKASLLDCASGVCAASAQSPQTEMPVLSPQLGWAEQHPEEWWQNVIAASRALRAAGHDLGRVQAIGITYQMHGLVLTDAGGAVVRPSIIWCDSRAVETGERCAKALGDSVCRKHLLNAPGNFTASKLRWVMEHEPELFRTARKAMLPGDYIAFRLTGETATTPSGLSEMILWDFIAEGPAQSVLGQYEIPQELLPKVVPTFAEQGRVSKAVAAELGLAPGTPVTYRAGDQPNNAFSLNVLEPGEVAATAGTSGVVYGVSATPSCDEFYRVNSFLHVTHTSAAPRLGILLCVNGTGILNSWARRTVMPTGATYQEMNELAASVPVGSDGLVILPYGNGAERTLGNRNLGASLHGLNLNRHGRSHILRAVQEGIVFSLFHGLEIMRDMGVRTRNIRAGNANMFLSPLFGEMFASITAAQVEIYDTDGAQGAARGAGVGAGVFSSAREAFHGLRIVKSYEPSRAQEDAYRQAYANWRRALQREMEQSL